MKRAIGIVIIIVVIGVGWYIYSKNTAPKTTPQQTDLSSAFPVGNSIDPSIPGTLPTLPTEQTGEALSTATAAAPTGFKQLSPYPIAGYSPVTLTTTTTVPPDPKKPNAKPLKQTVSTRAVRYVSRSNGYVYEIKNEESPLQISNIYIPSIYEALFADNGATVLLRFLRDDKQTIATYSVPVPPENTDGTRTQKNGLYFPDSISTVAISPDGTQVARITTDSSGSVLSTTTSTNNKKVELIRSPFREWILSWPTQKSIYLQTKASAAIPGYLYRVDTAEKKLRKVIGGINGLTASVSPSGTYVLYSQNNGTSFSTRLYNTKTGVTKSLGLLLLPEKCAWLKNDDLICAGNTTVPESQYPDGWYMGTVSFTDQLYHIYTGSVTYGTIYDGTARSFDMTNLTVNETDRFVYFIDKQTGILWQVSY